MYNKNHFKKLLNSYSIQIFMYIFIFFLGKQTLKALYLFFDYSYFLLENFFSFLVIYLAFKKDSIRLKISLLLCAALTLFIGYKYEISNNIAVIIFYLAIQHKKKLIKYALLSIFSVILVMPFVSPIFYQNKYGIPDIKDIDTSIPPNIVMINNPVTEVFQVDDYYIEIKKIASIELNAKAVFIEHYNKPFSYDYYEHPLYDVVAPLDLSVFIGEMADNWKNYKIEHEQRLLLVKPLNGENLTADEWNNIHIIPSNTNIHKGFHTVKKGDDIYLKGYLIDWNGLGEFNYFKIKTARYFGEASSEQAGGRFTYLCTQFLVEELNVNGYTFK